MAFAVLNLTESFVANVLKLPEIQILNWLYMQSQLTMGMGPYSVHVLHIWYPTSCISNLLHYYRPVGTKQSSFMGSYFKRVQLANCKNLKHDRIVIFLFADTFIFILSPKIPEKEILKFMVVAQNAFENCFHAMGLFQLKLWNLRTNFVSCFIFHSHGLPSSSVQSRDSNEWDAIAEDVSWFFCEYLPWYS